METEFDPVLGYWVAKKHPRPHCDYSGCSNPEGPLVQFPDGKYRHESCALIEKQKGKVFPRSIGY